MVERFGTIGHSRIIGGAGYDASLGLALAALIFRTRPSERKPPTHEQIAAADNRTERQRWNDEVVARKAAKKGSKP